MSESSLSFVHYQCSMSCGVGIQKRTISCRGVASEGWLLPGQRSYSACNQSERPASERYCSYGGCDSSYRWEVSNWSLVSLRLIPDLFQRIAYRKWHRGDYLFSSFENNYSSQTMTYFHFYLILLWFVYLSEVRCKPFVGLQICIQTCGICCMLSRNKFFFKADEFEPLISYSQFSECE